MAIVKSASTWQVSRVNVFAYGPPGSGKTTFGAGFPKPVFIDVEDGILSLRRLIVERGLQDIPIIQPENWGEIMALGLAPTGYIKKKLQGTEFEGYEFETLVLDTVGGMEDMCLQSIMGPARKVPDIGDYKPLSFQMRPLFKAMWAQPFHTVLLAHTYHGGIAMKDAEGNVKPASPPGPALTGSLRESGPGLADFYLRLDSERVGNKVRYFAETTTNEMGYPARVRGVKLPMKIYDPSFEILKKSLDELAQMKGGEKA